MRVHWQELGNVSSEPLEYSWFQKAHIFGHHAVNHGNDEVRSKWHVLQLATGTGKSQGTALYMSMMANLNDHPGALIVIARTADVNDMVETINEKANRPGYAFAYHSALGMAKPSLDSLKDFPVLVITHQALRMAMEGLDPSAPRRSSWNEFQAWGASGRQMVIIDESLDPVDVYTLNIDKLRMTLGAIPSEVRQRKALQGVMRGLETLIRRVEDAASASTEKHTKRIEVGDFLWGDEQWGMEELLAVVRGLPWDEIQSDISNPNIRKESRDAHLKRLKLADAIVREGVDLPPTSRTSLK